MRKEIIDNGFISAYNREHGPVITFRDGTNIYLHDESCWVPTLDGHCKTNSEQMSKSPRLKTSAMPCAADLMCMPCEQVPWPGSEGAIPPTVSPTTAPNFNGEQDANLSMALVPPPPKPHESTRIFARQQRRSLPKSDDGVTPHLLLLEDEAIGDGHRSIAISVSAKQLQLKGGNTGARATYLDLVSGPFFVEAFSGSGRMAASVRQKGLDAFEFDLTEQGCKNSTSCTRTSSTSSRL